MKIDKMIKVISLSFLLFLSACSKSQQQDGIGKEEKPVTLTQTEFKNPVFKPVLADPSVLQGSDGWFYAYGTEDDWGDGQGNRLVPVVRSLDLVKWTSVGNAFAAKPVWKTNGGIWAPDVVKVNNKYYMYYSFSTWQDTNPGIGLAIANQPGGPYSDQGKLFLSNEVDVSNTIDPFYIEGNDKKYLFFGSYSSSANQGTYALELSSDGRAIVDLGQKVKIAAGDFEAVMIHKRGNFYYFFGSKGGCCNGANSTYNVRVGRSSQLLGPYLDQAGRNITERGNGTLLLAGNERYAGPGHNSRIITDKGGNDWLMYHAIDRADPLVPNGASKRALMLDKITWVNDWPTIKNQTPGNEVQAGPAW